MKLVDILARELKVWPDQYYQIYQDSGGHLIGTLSNGDLEDCDQDDLPFDPVTIAWDGNNAVIERADWQAAVDALKVAEGIADAEAGNLTSLDDVKDKWLGKDKRAVEWDGKGMPPVGTVCEYQTWVNREWKQTKILAHHLGFAVHSWSVDGDDMEVDAAPPQDFRPIITPEQIAAEEREAEIIEIERVAMAGDSYKTMAEALYDAGYRKQVAP